MVGGCILRLKASLNTFVSTHCEAEVFSEYNIRLWKSRMGKTLRKAAFRALYSAFWWRQRHFLSAHLPCPPQSRDVYCSGHSAQGTAQTELGQGQSGTALRENHIWVLVRLLLQVCRIWPGGWASGIAKLLIQNIPWQAGRGLTFEFCTLPQHGASEISLKRLLELSPCPSPTHCSHVHPSLPRFAAASSSSPDVAVCPCSYLLDFPSHRGVPKGGATQAGYFLFFVSKHQPIPQSLVPSTLSFFWCFAGLLAPTNAINFVL